MLGTGSAGAHVKWFSVYDTAAQPRGLGEVLCQDFGFLLIVAILCFFSGCLVEQTVLGEPISRLLGRFAFGLGPHAEAVIRTGCGFFFVSLSTTGGILLTPELKTTSAVVGPLQLTIAAGLLSASTTPLSAAGVVALFSLAVRDYGIFHMADYSIFLGLSAYLALTGLQKRFLGVLPLDILRYSTAATLMWASVEKWAYPEWSFPLLAAHPNIALGINSESYMRAAGMIEFTLAFALLWTPLVRRLSAVVLLAMFVSACAEFGKVDIVGHSVIIVVLITIFADDRPKTADLRVPWLCPAAFSAALAATIIVYYASHAAIFNTTILSPLTSRGAY
ncbi:hypothetical protein [Neorhizobium galegae]